MPRKIAAGYTHSIRFIGSSRGNIAVPITLPSTGTIHAVVRMNRLYNHNSFWDSSGHNNQWECWQYQNKVIAARTGDSGLFVGSGAVENAKRFTAITLTWATGKNAKLYVDGELRPTQSMTNTASSGDTFYWGSGNALNSASEMNFVEGKIFSQELTAGEVNNLVNTANNPYAPLVWHRADSSQGATVTDLSGNGYSGTLTNGTYETDTPTKLRTAATNRVAAQDIKSSLSLTTPGTSRMDTTIAGSALNGGFTLATYVAPTVLSKKHHIFKSYVLNDKLWFNIESGGKFRMYNSDLSTPALFTSSAYLQVGKFTHTACTFDATTGTRVIYANGTSVATDTRTGTLTLGAEKLWVGGASDVTNDANAKFSNALVWNRALTATEIADLYKSGIVPTNGLLGRYKLDEGAGTTAYDTSGNNNHGTITNGTFTSDVPTKKRGVVGGNLVYNGDFSYAPPFTAATNTQYRSINGTAGGSNTPENLFGWGISSITGTCSAQYDNGAMKLSTTATSSKIDVKYLANASYKFPFLPMLPNTSYTLTARIKTNLISGSATTGARLQVLGLNGGMTASNTYTVVNGLVSTKEWTDYSLTFTTSASVRFFDIVMSVVGNDGAATLIMDAWFSNIELRPTSNIVRNVVT